MSILKNNSRRNHYDHQIHQTTSFSDCFKALWNHIIENVKDNQNRVALQRGPLVYCFEHSDNDGKVMDIVLPDKAIFKTAFDATLLNGIVSIQTQAPVAKISAGGLTVNSVNRKITAIPYYTWANRGKGQMQVWVPRKITNVSLSSK